MTGSTDDAEGAVTHSASPRSRPGWGDVAWIAILTAIGLVQIIRAQWFDAAVFLLIVVLLLVAGRVPATGGIDPATRRIAVRPLLIGTLALAGLIGVLLPRHSLAMQALLLATGVLVLTVAWQGPARRSAPWPPGLRRLAVTWTAIVVAGCLWELVEFILGRVWPQRPSFALSDLVDPLLDGLPGRALFIALWVMGGVFLVTRRPR